MKVTLKELRGEASRVFGAAASVSDCKSLCFVELRTGSPERHALRFYGKSAMAARRFALVVLRGMT